jgi:hypothetical protein
MARRLGGIGPRTHCPHTLPALTQMIPCVDRIHGIIPRQHLTHQQIAETHEHREGEAKDLHVVALVAS